MSFLAKKATKHPLHSKPEKLSHYLYIYAVEICTHERSIIWTIAKENKPL